MTHQNQFLQPQLKLLAAPKQSDTDAVVAGKPMSEYLKLTAKPILAALALLIVSEFTDVIPYFHLLVVLVMFSYLGLAAQSRSFAIEASCLAGGLAGGTLGLCYAFFRFIVHLKFPMFFQMITEPIMLAALGALVAGSVNWLMTEGRVRISQTVNKK